jgi:hypothetical protein
MISLITALVLATTLNVAQAKKAVPHRHHAHTHSENRGKIFKPKHHRHLTHRHHQYTVPKPPPPPHAKGSHVVYFYRSHWVRHHHKSHLIWKWNHHDGRWTIAIKF